MLVLVSLIPICSLCLRMENVSQFPIAHTSDSICRSHSDHSDQRVARIQPRDPGSPLNETLAGKIVEIEAEEMDRSQEKLEGDRTKKLSQVLGGAVG